MAREVKSGSIIMVAAVFSTSVMAADLWDLYKTHAPTFANASAPKKPFDCYDCEIGGRSFAVLEPPAGYGYLARGDSELAAEAIYGLLAQATGGCAWGGSAGCAAKDIQTCTEITENFGRALPCMDHPESTIQFCDAQHYEQAKTNCSQQGDGRCMWWNAASRGGHNGACVSPDVALRLMLTSNADFSLFEVCRLPGLQAAEPCTSNPLAEAFGCQWQEEQEEVCSGPMGCSPAMPAECFHSAVYDWQTVEDMTFARGDLKDAPENMRLNGVVGQPLFPGAAPGSAFHPASTCTALKDEATCLGEDVSCAEVQEIYRANSCCSGSGKQVLGLKKYGARRLQGESTKADDNVKMLELELKNVKTRLASVEARLAAARQARLNQ